MEHKLKPKKILIADDSVADAEILRQLLADNGYASVLVSNGIDAIEMALKEFPDLILLDVDMPGENGYEVARQLKGHRRTRFVPIIMLTGLSELGAKLQGIEAGVDDYITKPYRPIELLTRIRSLLRVKSLNDHLDDAESIVFTLARIIEAKDSYTLGHADRVSRYAVALGKLLNCSPADLETLDRGGVLHDIGKMAIPDHILLKPDALTKEEFGIMKTHPLIGCTMCERLRSAQEALPLIRNHHEKLDGSGYPDCLHAHEIPLMVRILTVVDIYDALTTRRTYKKAWTKDQAFITMYDEVRQGWWDGDLVRIWEKFVRSEEFATVLPQSRRGSILNNK